MTRPQASGRPVAVFVTGRLGDQWAGMARAWVRRLNQFEEAGWQVHVATVLHHKDFDRTPEAWRDRGWLAADTQIHHYRLRDRRLRTSWRRPTDHHFARDQRVSSWLDWLVGLMPGAVVFADSPVTYAPVALMGNPHVAKVMTLHLSHRASVKGRAVPMGPPQPIADPWLPPSAHQPKQYKGHPGEPKLAARFLPFAGAADIVVAPTALQAKHLAEDLPGLVVRHIPNIVEHPVADVVPRDMNLVVTMGRLDPLKRIDHVIHAVLLARRSLPEVRLAVYGRGPDQPRLAAIVEEHRLSDIVTFPGYVANADAVLAGAGISVHASRREAFGLSVAESLAAGTPVVAYDVDYGPAELISDGVNGRLVPSGSAKDLASAIVDVLGDGSTRARMAQAAPRTVEQLRAGVVGAQWLELASELSGAVEPAGGEFLLEDIRVEKSGLRFVGVAHGPAPSESSLRMSDEGDSRLPSGSHAGAAGTVTRGTFAPLTTAAAAATPREVGLLLPWASVTGVPVGSRLSAASETGEPMAIRASGGPVALVPTSAGPILLGAEEGTFMRLGDVVAPEVSIADGRLWWADGDRRADLTPALGVSGTVLGGGRLACRVEQSGIRLAPSTEILITDTAPLPQRRVMGSVTLERGEWIEGHWTCAGAIDWDDVAASAVTGSSTGPVVLQLSMEDRRIALGRLTVATRWPVRVNVGVLLVRGKSGHVMLVGAHGRGARVLWALRQARA